MTRDDTFLRKEYGKTLVPVMFSVLGGTINTLIDSTFVSQRLGNDGLAAVNMCMPLFLIFCTLGSLLAGGASIMSAQEAGSENLEKSRQYYHTAITVCVLAGFLLSVVGLMSAREVSAFFAQGSTLTPYVYEYCLVSFAGVIPTVMVYLPIYYLQLEGKRHSISVMMGITICVDIVLDWIFMFVFDFGIAGAAWASVISTLISCIYGMFMLEHGFSNFHFSFKNLGFFGLGEILRYGSPAAVGNLLDAVKMFLLNMIILKAGGEGAIAVWAVLNALSELSLCLVAGIPQAAAQMIGVYYSGRENSAIRILMRLQIKVGLFTTVVFCGILLAAHSIVEDLFAMDGSLVFPLACLSLYIFSEIVCSIWGDFFNVTDKIALSNLLMICRSFLLPVGIAGFLAMDGGYLWLFLPISGLAALLVLFLVTEGIARRQKQTAHPVSRILLLDDELERSGKVLDFSINPTMENICDASDQIFDFCSSNEMDAKQTNRIRLAIEELLTVIAEKNPNLASVDLRAFALDNSIGIRVRCAGRKYNPFEAAEEDEDDFYLGVNLLSKMAKKTKYSYTLGMNTINISF